MFNKFHVIRTGLLFVVLSAGINLCFGQMYWTKSYDRGDIHPLAMKPTADGNYIIAGWTYFPLVSSPGWFAKINPNGDTLWTKTFGVSETNQFYAIESIDGNFFLLVGYTHSNGISNNYKGWIVKINTNGDVIWTRTYEQPGEVTSFRAIQKCTDGNFLIAGSLLVKITPDGDTLWTRSNSGMFFSTLVCSDENYLIAGQNQDSVSGKEEILLLKINNAGKTVWTRNLHYSWATKLFSAGDGNYLLLGGSNTGALVLKITSEGDIIWSRTYSLPESSISGAFTDIISSMDGGFLIIGNRLLNTGNHPWHLKINKMGDTLWTRTSSRYDYFTYSYILPAEKGTFLALGTTSTKWIISCMVDDEYAKKDSLFSYKIPTRGLDSLNCGYQLLNLPSGMTVSAGGTISWTPQTDSSYLENAKFIVADDQGSKDTLSLNIFVNMKNLPSTIRSTHQVPKDKASDFFTVTSHLERGKVQFNFPASTGILFIYDMCGRLIDRINPVSSTGRQTILWPAGGTGVHSGQYIARAVAGKRTEAKVFMLGR